MATTCRWFAVAENAVPSYFRTQDGSLDTTKVISAADAASQGVVSTTDLALAVQNVVNSFVKQGEDEADATANVNQGKTYVGRYDNTLYIFFVTAEAGVWVYKQKCGMSAQLPIMILGAGALGLGGFVWGKRGKKGFPAKALMGATVGVLVGAALGYGLSALATDKTTKGLSQLGLLNIQTRTGLLDVRMGSMGRHRMCPPHTFWSDWAHRCVRPM